MRFGGRLWRSVEIDQIGRLIVDRRFRTGRRQSVIRCAQIHDAGRIRQLFNGGQRRSTVQFVPVRVHRTGGRLRTMNAGHLFVVSIDLLRSGEHMKNEWSRGNGSKFLRFPDRCWTAAKMLVVMGRGSSPWSWSSFTNRNPMDRRDTSG